ncbi:uncharacterized protein TNCV_1027461 [Trichonephila clavipes]|nr:uncharacterized protein TNCV_1027461 [Trichonephila clavipes]
MDLQLMNNQFLLAYFDLTPPSTNSVRQNHHNKSNLSYNSNDSYRIPRNEDGGKNQVHLDLTNNEDNLLPDNNSSHVVNRTEESDAIRDDSLKPFWNVKSSSSSSASDEDFMLCCSEEILPICSSSRSQSPLNLSEESLDIASKDVKNSESDFSRQNSESKLISDSIIGTNVDDQILSECLENMKESSKLSCETKDMIIQSVAFEDARLHPFSKKEFCSFDNNAQHFKDFSPESAMLLNDSLRISNKWLENTNELSELKCEEKKISEQQSYDEDKILCSISKRPIVSNITSDVNDNKSTAYSEIPYKDTNFPPDKNCKILQNVKKYSMASIQKSKQERVSKDLFFVVSENLDDLNAKNRSVKDMDLCLCKLNGQSVFEDDSLASVCQQQAKSIQTSKVAGISFSDIESSKKFCSEYKAKDKVLCFQSDSIISKNIFNDEHKNSTDFLKKGYSKPISCDITENTFIKNIKETRNLFQKTEAYSKEVLSNNFIRRSKFIEGSLVSIKNLKAETGIRSSQIDSVSIEPKDSLLQFSNNPQNYSFGNVIDSFNFVPHNHNMKTNKCINLKVDEFRSGDDSMQVATFQSKALHSSDSCSLKFSPNLDFIRRRKVWDFDMTFQIEESDSALEMKTVKKKFVHEDDKKSTLPMSEHKCITFSANTKETQLCKEKEHFSVYQKQNNDQIVINSSYRSDKAENKLNNPEFDNEEFVSASEDDSSSSDAFFETEEFCETFDLEFSKKNSCSQDLPDNLLSNFSYNFMNGSPLKSKVKNHVKSQATSTENDSQLHSLILDGPVIIKYMDEQTHQVEKMLIYPLDYFEFLFGKSDIKYMSKEEKLEKLIEESKMYIGKPVGIISNLKDVLKSINKKFKVSPPKNSLFTEGLKESITREVKQTNIEKNGLILPKRCILPICSFDETDKSSPVACKGKVYCSTNDSELYPISRPQRYHHCTTSTPKEYTSSKKIKITCNGYTKSSMNSLVPCLGNSIEILNNKIKYSEKHKNIFASSHQNSVLKSHIPLAKRKLDITPLKSNTYHGKNTSLLKDSTPPLTFSSSFAIKKTLDNVNILRASEKNIVHIPPANFKGSSVVLFNSTDEQKVKISRKTQSFNIVSERTANRKHSAHTHSNLRYRSAKVFSSVEIEKYNSSKRKDLDSFHEKQIQNSNILAKKKTSVEEIISSNFKMFFSFYAKLGGRLKSGSVISKLNSNHWLKKTGVIYDDKSMGVAEISFAEVAK